MPPEGVAAPLPTYFAPAERATPDDIRLARERLLSNELAVTLLNSVPDLAMVLNEQRQIIAVNDQVLRALGFERPDELLGLRPGELVDCVHAADAPGGCGTGPSCSVCGAVNAILQCLETQQPTVSECRVRTRSRADGGALDLEVHATPLEIG
ncbi:MAG: PAS domain-containing protein, partial [Armatimonadetes bacterium]|nr:PAS domain-containing protein [Armatimonadota bacterium]